MTLAKTKAKAKARTSRQPAKRAAKPSSLTTGPDANANADSNDHVVDRKDNGEEASAPNSPTTAIAAPVQQQQKNSVQLSIHTDETARNPASIPQDKRSAGSAGTTIAGSTAALTPKPSAKPINAEPKSTAVSPPRHQSLSLKRAGQPSTAYAVQQAQPLLMATGDLSLTQIISEYGERTDLLRLVLAAKTEQDRARAEYERRLQEEMRFETRRIEFEMMLHSNYFKQQEQQQQQQHIMAPPPAHAAAGHIHRSDVVVHSPIGPSQAVHYPAAQQQQGPPLHMVAPPNGAYGVPVVAAPSHDAHMRAYHHPDTPGGLDAYGQNPFAFFKMPLGTQIHHPSAYKTHEKGSSQHAQGRHIGDTPPSSGSSQEAVRSHANGPQRQQTMPQDGGLGVTRERRTVPPAVSGLSLRINSDQKGDSDAPRSAPVDGPNQKRRISHDDVIMALRRKVMGKNGFQAQHHHSQQRQMPQLTPISVGPSSGGRQNSDDRSKMYRSSLSTISQVDSPDCIPEETSSSSSSSSSSAHADEADSALRSLASTATTENEDRRDSQQQRASSISHIVDSEPMPEAAKSVSSTS